MKDQLVRNGGGYHSAGQRMRPRKTEPGKMRQTRAKKIGRTYPDFTGFSGALRAQAESKAQPPKTFITASTPTPGTGR